jgi:hypothetical protein
MVQFQGQLGRTISMKTLRYNISTQQYTTHSGVYKDCDQKSGRINLPWVQLEVIETTKPAYTNNQKISLSYDIDIDEEPHDPYSINGTATQVWIVTDKTEEEIVKDKEDYNKRQQESRSEAYKQESDPLFFKYQRGEAVKQEWIDKVDEIRGRYSYI